MFYQRPCEMFSDSPAIGQPQILVVTYDLENSLHFLERSLGERYRHRVRDSGVVHEYTNLDLGRLDPSLVRREGFGSGL